MEFLCPPVIALGQLVDMHLPVLAVPPGVGFHRRRYHPPVALIQAVDDGPHVGVVQFEVEDVILIERVCVLVVIHHDPAVLVLPGGPLLRRLPAVRHHQGFQLPPGQGVDHKGLVVLVELCNQFVEKRAGVLVHIWADVPEVILPLLDLLVAPEGPKLTSPQSVGYHVRAHPEAQLPDLELLRGLEQLLACHLHRRCLLASHQPSKKIQCRVSHLQTKKSQPPITR